VDEGREDAIRRRFAAQRLSPESVERSLLDAVPWQYAGRTLDIEIVHEEFTHICPMTGLPDFGTLTVRYLPDRQIIELKSLKYYLLQYRQVGIFYEHVVHRILDDLVAVIAPRRLTLRYDVRPRGGIGAHLEATWPQP
jgi:7-cyano-7-deazaguanine reductase